eukprot:1150401-Pelagomonas_calceolata.AAC.2
MAFTASTPHAPDPTAQGIYKISCRPDPTAPGAASVHTSGAYAGPTVGDWQHQLHTMRHSSFPGPSHLPIVVSQSFVLHFVVLVGRCPKKVNVGESAPTNRMMMCGDLMQAFCNALLHMGRWHKH